MADVPPPDDITPLEEALRFLAAAGELVTDESLRKRGVRALGKSVSRLGEGLGRRLGRVEAFVSSLHQQLLVNFENVESEFVNLLPLEEEEEYVDIFIGSNVHNHQPREVRSRLWYISDKTADTLIRHPSHNYAYFQEENEGEEGEDASPGEGLDAKLAAAWNGIAKVEWPPPDPDPSSFYALFLESPDAELCMCTVDEESESREGHNLEDRVDDMIRRDIARTFPNVARFNETAGKEALFRVLLAYATCDTAVSYCQGMGFIVGLLLMYLPENAAFAAFVWLMYPPPDGRGLREMYRPGLVGLKTWLDSLDALIHSLRPRLAEHLQTIGISSVLFASDWILTMFAYTFPASFSAKVLDMVFTEESLVPVLRVGIILVSAAEPQLMDACDMESIVRILKQEVPRWSAERLEGVLASASKMRLSQRDIENALKAVEACPERPAEPDSGPPPVESEDDLKDPPPPHPLATDEAQPENDETQGGDGDGTLK